MADAHALCGCDSLDDRGVGYIVRFDFYIERFTFCASAGSDGGYVYIGDARDFPSCSNWDCHKLGTAASAETTATPIAYISGCIVTFQSASSFRKKIYAQI